MRLIPFIMLAIVAAHAAEPLAPGTTVFLKKKVSALVDGGLGTYEARTTGRFVSQAGTLVTLEIAGKMVRVPASEVTTDANEAAGVQQQARAQEKERADRLQAIQRNETEQKAKMARMQKEREIEYLKHSLKMTEFDLENTKKMPKVMGEQINMVPVYTKGPSGYRTTYKKVTEKVEVTVFGEKRDDRIKRLTKLIEDMKAKLAQLEKEVAALPSPTPTPVSTPKVSPYAHKAEIADVSKPQTIFVDETASALGYSISVSGKIVGEAEVRITLGDEVDFKAVMKEEYTRSSGNASRSEPAPIKIEYVPNNASSGSVTVEYSVVSAPPGLVAPTPEATPQIRSKEAEISQIQAQIKALEFHLKSMKGAPTTLPSGEPMNPQILEMRQAQIDKLTTKVEALKQRLNDLGGATSGDGGAPGGN